MPTSRRTPRLFAGLVALLALLFTLAACGGDSDSGSSSGSGSGSSAGDKDKDKPGAGKTVTVGSANFGEAEIIANMYAEVLREKGYDVKEKFNVGNREVYLKALESGEIDVVPEYIGTLTEELNKQVNGAAAAQGKPLASSDPDKTFEALKTLVAQKKWAVTEYSKAADQNAFAVTKETADKYGLKSLSDLAKPEVQGQLVLGGPPECDVRPFCLPGLEKTYGAKFKGAVKKLDAGGPKTLGALKDGTIQIGLVFSSDGAVVANNLVVLADDKQLQTADNIVALVKADKVDADAQEILASVNEALTTEQLQELNKRFNVDKEDARDLAEDFIKDNDLEKD